MVEVGHEPPPRPRVLLELWLQGSPRPLLMPVAVWPLVEVGLEPPLLPRVLLELWLQGPPALLLSVKSLLQPAVRWGPYPLLLVWAS